MIISFYAFKGGLGRSMALANVADLLRKAGRRVLMVDWDLEGPGLEYFFCEDDPKKLSEVRARPGLIDLLADYSERAEALGHPIAVRDFELQEHQESGLLPDLDTYVFEVLSGERQPSLLLLPAGQRDPGAPFEAYARRVRAFEWKAFIEQGEYEGALFYEWLRQQLLERADVVLIDARTGVSETAGVCTHLLSDAIFLFCSANPQSIDGTAAMTSSLLEVAKHKESSGRSLDLVVVPARIETSFAAVQKFFRDQFNSKIAPLLGVDFDDDRQRELLIPYTADYSFRETIVEPSLQIGRAYRAIESRIQKLLARPEIALLGADADRQVREELVSRLKDYLQAEARPWSVHFSDPSHTFVARQARPRLRRSRDLLLLWSAAAAADCTVHAVLEEFLRHGRAHVGKSRQVSVVRLDDEPLPGSIASDDSTRTFFCAGLDKDEVDRCARELATFLKIERPDIALVPYFTSVIVSNESIEMPDLSKTAAGRRFHPPAVSLEDLFVERKLVKRAAGDEKKEALPLSWLMQQLRVVVLGEPGAGKTTLLRYLALRLARLQLDRDPGALAELGLGEKPVPVFLRFPDVAAAFRRDLSLGPDARLAPDALQMDRWLAVIERSTGLEGDLLDRLFKEGRVVVLLDALDEVTWQQNRNGLMSSLRSLAARFEDHPSGRFNRWIVTCRPDAWRSTQGFEETSLVSFDVDEIDSFIDRWCRAHQDLDRRDLKDAMHRALEVQNIKELARNPNHLTILAQLYSTGMLLPQNKATLFRNVVDRQIEMRQEFLQEWGNPEVIRAYHIVLAEEILARAELNWGNAVKLLRERARDLTGQARSPEHAEDLLESLIVYAGLLRSESVPRPQETRVGFRHRSFLEYFVAEGIAQEEQPALALLSQAEREAWPEVVEFTSGILAMERDREQFERFLQVFADIPKNPNAKPEQIRDAAAVLSRLSHQRVDEGAQEQEVVRKALNQILAQLEDPRQKTSRRFRIAIAKGLARGVPDPRLTEQGRWISVPSGAFWRGAEDGEAPADEQPFRRVGLSYSYRIARWPVTNAEFNEFARVGYENAEHWSREGVSWLHAAGKQGLDKRRERLQTATNERGNHPVTSVTWWEAEAYCQWLGRKLVKEGTLAPGHWVRLPTEEEWEKAGRGGILLGERKNPKPHRRFPWGDVFHPDYLNCSFERGPVDDTTPVGCFPAGNGPYDCWDLAGNVAEWCLDVYQPNRNRIGPTEIEAPLEPPVSDERWRAVRGGSWRNSAARSLRVSCRGSRPPGTEEDSVGFRCVIAPRTRPAQPTAGTAGGS